MGSKFDITKTIKITIQYLILRFVFNFFNLGFINKFNKQDKIKLITAPKIANMAVINISSAFRAANEDRKVPLAVPIAMGSSL